MITAPDRATVFRWSTQNRLLMVDVLAGLTDEQWELPTLCDGCSTTWYHRRWRRRSQVTGRPAALPDLTGDGVTHLAAQICR